MFPNYTNQCYINATSKITMKSAYYAQICSSRQDRIDSKLKIANQYLLKVLLSKKHECAKSVIYWLCMLMLHQSKMNIDLEIRVVNTLPAPILVFGVLCVLLNSVLIHVLKKLKKLETTSFKFILMLSISDTGLGVLSICFCSICLFFKGKVNSAFFISMYILFYWFGMFSFGMISVISVDRYIHMRYLTHYNTMMTNRRGMIIVGATAFISACFAVLLVCGRLFGFAFDVQIVINLIVACWIIIVFLLYIKAYKAIRCRTQQMQLDDSLPQTASERRNASREFSRAVLVILCTLVTCYTPYLIFSLKRYRMSKDDNELNVFLEYVAFCFVSANSSLNAIIMLTFNKDLRNFLLRIFKTQEWGFAFELYTNFYSGLVGTKQYSI